MLAFIPFNVLFIANTASQILSCLSSTSWLKTVCAEPTLWDGAASVWAVGLVAASVVSWVDTVGICRSLQRIKK